MRRLRPVIAAVEARHDARPAQLHIAERRRDDVRVRGRHGDARARDVHGARIRIARVRERICVERSHIPLIPVAAAVRRSIDRDRGAHRRAGLVETVRPRDDAKETGGTNGIDRGVAQGRRLGILIGGVRAGEIEIDRKREHRSERPATVVRPQQVTGADVVDRARVGRSRAQRVDDDSPRRGRDARLEHVDGAKRWRERFASVGHDARDVPRVAAVGRSQPARAVGPMDRRRVEQLRIDGIDRKRLNRRDGDVVGERRPRRAVVRRPPNAAAVGPDVERRGNRRMWHDGRHASAERRWRRVARHVDGLRPDGHPPIASEGHEQPGVRIGPGVAYRARQGIGRRRAAGRIGPLQDEPALAVVGDRRRDDARGRRPVDARERNRRQQDRRQRQVGQHPRCVS